MCIYSSLSKKKCVLFQMKKKKPHRGGKREGAGRPSEGKGRYTLTLTEQNVAAAKAKESNFSGLLDRLLSDWLSDLRVGPGRTA